MARTKVKRTEISPEAIEAFRNTISPDKALAQASRDAYAQALQEPLRETLLSGNIYSDIFTIEPYPMNVKPTYMLDWVVPGTEADYVGYTIPAQGELPRKIVYGDYVEVPSYEIGASLDWNRRMPEVAGPQFLRKANSRLEQMMVKKKNDDAFHALLMAAVDRGIVVYDATAAANQFTRRLVSVMNLVMRRNAGGNSVTNARKLTDIYMSLEALEDTRNWGLDLIPDAIRTQIYNSDDGLKDIYGVSLHSLFELGVGQEYQDYYTNSLGGLMASGDSEICLGFDLTQEDSFVMPVNEQAVVRFDDQERMRLQGIWVTEVFGIGILDARRLVVGSL